MRARRGPPRRPSSNVGGTDKGVFTFPKVGTAYTRTARWTRELALVGTPLRRSEVTQVRWRGTISQESETFVADDVLESVTLERDGGVLGEARAVGRPVVVRYRIGKDGRLNAVEGASDAADAFLSLLPAESQTAAAKETLRGSLEDTAFVRSDRFRDVVGKPARVGETWTVKAAADNAAAPAAAVSDNVRGEGGRDLRARRRIRSGHPEDARCIV